MLPFFVVLVLVSILFVGVMYLYIRYLLFERGLKDNNIPLVQHLDRKVIIPEVVEEATEKKREEFTLDRLNRLLNRSKENMGGKRKVSSRRLFKKSSDIRRAMILTYIFGDRKSY